MYNTDYFKKLANQLMFDLNDKEAEEVQERFVTFMEQIKLLEAIDTDGIEPMIYPFEESQVNLRDDVSVNVLTQEQVLMNAKNIDNGYFEIPKVVK